MNSCPGGVTTLQPSVYEIVAAAALSESKVLQLRSGADSH